MTADTALCNVCELIDDKNHMTYVETEFSTYYVCLDCITDELEPAAKAALNILRDRIEALEHDLADALRDLERHATK